MLRFKLDVLSALKDKGVTPYSARSNSDIKISQSTFTLMKKGDKMVSIETIGEICRLLQCQPGDLIEWVPDED